MLKKFLSCMVALTLTFSALSAVFTGAAAAGAAENVIHLIDSVFPVTYKSVVPLKQAVSAYEALPESEKQMVSNASRIAEAQIELDALHAAFSVKVGGWSALQSGCSTSWMGDISTAEQQRTRQAMADEIKRLYTDEGYMAYSTTGLVSIDSWAPTWTPSGIMLNLDAAGSDNIGKVHGEPWGYPQIGTLVCAPFPGMAFSQIRYMSQDFVANNWTPFISDTFLYNGRYYCQTWNKVKSYDSSIPEVKGNVLNAQQMTYQDSFPGKGIPNQAYNTFRYAYAKFGQDNKAAGKVLGVPAADGVVHGGVAYQAFIGPLGEAYIAAAETEMKKAADTPEKPEGAYAIFGEVAAAFKTLGDTDQARFAVTGAPVGEQYEVGNKVCQDFALATLAVDKDTGALTQTSNDTSLRNFTIPGGVQVDGLGEGVNILVPAGTDITRLTPTFDIHEKSTVTPAKGPQDFTDSITYTVTAEVGTTKDYVVTVIVQGPGSPADQAAAAAVVAAIDRLPEEPSLSDAAGIRQVKTAYDALSPRQKYLVDNTDKLETALEDLRILEKGKIKVACIGDSITEGDVGGGVNTAASYPSQLQEMLGEGYEVKNFGKCGFCMAKNSNAPYWNLGEFTASQNYQPDIVIIMMGTNDAWSGNWANVQNNFESDYTEFVNIYKDLASEPIIYLTKVSGVHGDDRLAVPTVNEIIARVAENTETQLIDMYTWENNLSPGDKAKYFTDNLHPNAEGYTLMADQFKQQVFVPLEDCTLKNIQINGTDLTDFTPGQTAYTITLPQSADMPVLTAQTTTGVAQLKITQPTAANTTGKITVTAGNPFFKQNYTVNVIREGSGPLTEIEVKTPELAVEEGKEAKLEVVLTPADAADKALAYESSNPAVAAVDETGRITALDSGTAVITVASKANPTLKATCTVTVYVKGDLTGDGNVNISDVMAACKVLARKSADQQPTPDEVLRGDVNGDTYVTITDIMAICKILAERA